MGEQDRERRKKGKRGEGTYWLHTFRSCMSKFIRRFHSVMCIAGCTVHGVSRAYWSRAEQRGVRGKMQSMVSGKEQSRVVSRGSVSEGRFRAEHGEREANSEHGEQRRIHSREK